MKIIINYYNQEGSIREACIQLSSQEQLHALKQAVQRITAIPPAQ